MFYWYFQNRNLSDTAPLVLWLTGGPGCSGSLAVFAENGPFSVTSLGDLEEREYAWDVEVPLLVSTLPLFLPTCTRHVLRLPSI